MIVFEYLNTDLRILNNERLRSTKKLTAYKNQIERWLSIYFPEYKRVFKDFEAESSLIVLENACLPADVVAMGVEGINSLWRAENLGLSGLRRPHVLLRLQRPA